MKEKTLSDKEIISALGTPQDTLYIEDVKQSIKRLKVKVHYFVRGTHDRNRLLNQIDKIFGDKLI